MWERRGKGGRKEGLKRVKERKEGKEENPTHGPDKV